MVLRESIESSGRTERRFLPGVFNLPTALATLAIAAFAGCGGATPPVAPGGAGGDMISTPAGVGGVTGVIVAGGTGGRSGSTCTAPIVPGAVATLTDQYLPASVIGNGGYTYAYSDGMGSTACVDSGALCATGTTGVATSAAVWGAGIGFRLNQAHSADGNTPVHSYAITGSGVSYSVSGVPAQGMRIVIDSDGLQYCAKVTLASGTLLWSAFNSKCWDNTGASLTTAPTDATYINFQISAGPIASGFEFCVMSVAFAPPRPVVPVGIGSACSSSAGCTSNLCSTGGWCTATCTTNVQCGINTYGQLDWCVRNAAGVNTCFPGCLSNADCLVYGSGVTCHSTTATNGAATTVCATP